MAIKSFAFASCRTVMCLRAPFQVLSLGRVRSRVNPSVIVVADAHLVRCRPRRKGVSRIPRGDPRPGSPHLMGDLFDFWFEYSSVIPEHLPPSPSCRRSAPAHPDQFVAATTIAGADRFHADLGIEFFGGAPSSYGRRRASLPMATASRAALEWRADAPRAASPPSRSRCSCSASDDRVLDRRSVLAITSPTYVRIRRGAGSWRPRRSALGRRFPERRADVRLVIMAHTHRPIVEPLPDGRAYLNTQERFWMVRTT